MSPTVEVGPPEEGDHGPRPALPDPTAAGRMGLFLICLAVFFAAGLVAFVVSRL
jgi:hypothetical protein